MKAEDLVNGYSNYRQNSNIGRAEYEMDEREMFIRRNDTGILDDDDDSDEEFSFNRKKKERRGSFWRRRSKSRTRTSVGAS